MLHVALGMNTQITLKLSLGNIQTSLHS